MSLKKIIVSSIAAAAVATSAFAGSATLSANSKGDYLVYPVYYSTTDGWSTNVRVVNTNTTHAVIAKVVVREYATSKELLDFPIYLSPGDVWEADLINNGSTVNVVSTDDSSPEVPMNQPLFNNNPLVGTANGYVEILAIATKSAFLIDPVTPWSMYTPLAKSKIKTDYETATAANHNGWVAPIATLFGQQVVSETTAGAEKSMTLMATAQAITLTAAEDAARNISSGAVFATDTLAASIYYATVDADIRANIAKDSVYAINYTGEDAETQILLTQATKHTNPDADATQVVPYYATTAAEKAANNSDSKFYFVGRTWDNSENTYTQPGTIYSGTTTVNSAEQCTTEICYIYYGDFVDATGPVNTRYAEGWVDIVLGTTATGGATLPQTIPTITTIMTGTKVNGVGITNMLPGAYQE